MTHKTSVKNIESGKNRIKESEYILFKNTG